MSNSYYNPSGTPAASSAGASAPVRGEFSSIAAGFAKLPTLDPALAGLPIVMNPSGTGLQAALGSTSGILFKLKSANMNTTADQAFTAVGWSSGSYRITEIYAYNNVNAAPSTAAGGIYSAVSKGGNIIVPAAETYASITGANQGKLLDFATGAPLVPYSTLPYLSLTTPQGAACLLDIVIVGILLP